jgi:sortase (surface protein transpeptidase)
MIKEPYIFYTIVVFGLIILFVLAIGIISRIQEHRMYKYAQEWNEKRNQRMKKNDKLRRWL